MQTVIEFCPDFSPQPTTGSKCWEIRHQGLYQGPRLLHSGGRAVLGQAAPGRLWGVLAWRRDGGASWGEEASRPGDPLVIPSEGQGVSPSCSLPRGSPPRLVPPRLPLSAAQAWASEAQAVRGGVAGPGSLHLRESRVLGALHQAGPVLHAASWALGMGS